MRVRLPLSIAVFITLPQLFYKGSVAEEALAAEQDRIERERTEVRRWGEAATRDASQVMDTLNEALVLLEKSRIFYRQAAPPVRRLLIKRFSRRF